MKLRKNIIRTLWGARSPRPSRPASSSSAGTRTTGPTCSTSPISTQANKSEASVKRIIEFLADKDSHNVGGRAAWGLGQGVAREQHGLVADAALKVVAARSDGYLFREA